jgi:hypothetical protein
MDKAVDISFRGRDQLKLDVVWEVLGKVVQSNARFGSTDRLEVHVAHVRMLAGNGGVKTKARSIDAMSAIKRIIVVVKAAFLCLARALVIVMTRANGDPQVRVIWGRKLLDKPVEELMRASGVDLSNGGGVQELQFQAYLSDYQVTVYDGLSPDIYCQRKFSLGKETVPYL